MSEKKEKVDAPDEGELFALIQRYAPAIEDRLRHSYLFKPFQLIIAGLLANKKDRYYLRKSHRDQHDGIEALKRENERLRSLLSQEPSP